MLNRRWLLSSLCGGFAFHGLSVGAQETNCFGSMGNVEVRGNLNIASRCELAGTTVTGNVTLFEGGALIATGGVDIRGNLTARRADFVAIDGAEIDGNVTLEELVGDESTLRDNEIGGSLTLTRNRSALEILNNDIGGTLRATSNTGGVLISGNSIDDHLDCSGNSPAPMGTGNRVDGQRRGQCRNLRAPPPSGTSPPTPGGDRTPPTLTLVGEASVTLTVGSPYTDAGATAMDSTDGDLTPRIVVTNHVNTSLIGTFTVEYAVSDLSGNAATPVTRTVTITPLPAEGGGGGGAFGWPAVLLLLVGSRYLKRRRSEAGPTNR